MFEENSFRQEPDYFRGSSFLEIPRFQETRISRPSYIQCSSSTRSKHINCITQQDAILSRLSFKRTSKDKCTIARHQVNSNVVWFRNREIANAKVKIKKKNSTQFFDAKFKWNINEFAVMNIVIFRIIVTIKFWNYYFITECFKNPKHKMQVYILNMVYIIWGKYRIECDLEFARIEYIKYRFKILRTPQATSSS